MFLQNDDTLEIELTSKCTLACPGCSRVVMEKHKDVWDGGHLPTQLIKDIANTTDFRKYSFIGCYGDVIYHPDFLDIIKHYRDLDKSLAIHTNGSFKTAKWWEKAKQINWTTKTEFVFSVDGLADTNHLYRINSRWDMLWYGMQAMSSIPKPQRPYLEWKYIIFPYNEHQVDEARIMCNDLGFDNFYAVYSNRKEDQYMTEHKELYIFD
jgi:MoaA/NifB/PqqE/SkfB family radical SAM enzyme